MEERLTELENKLNGVLKTFARESRDTSYSGRFNLAKKDALPTVAGVGDIIVYNKAVYACFTSGVWSRIGTDGTAKALGTTGAVTLDPTTSKVFTITPTGNTQISATVFPDGIYSLVIKTSGTSNYVIGFQTGFTTVSTFSTGTLDGRYFTITFVCDGVGFREIARSVAMLPY